MAILILHFSIVNEAPWSPADHHSPLTTHQSTNPLTTQMETADMHAQFPLPEDVAEFLDVLLSGVPLTMAATRCGVRVDELPSFLRQPAVKQAIETARVAHRSNVQAVLYRSAVKGDRASQTAFLTQTALSADAAQQEGPDDGINDLTIEEVEKLLREKGIPVPSYEEFEA